MLKEGWQNAIREKNSKGHHIEAERDLKKAKMGYYNQLNFEDKYFIDYCLAFYYVKNDNVEMANKFMSEILVLFNKNRDKLRFHQLEVSKYNWLFVNTNYKKMTKEDIEDIMMNVYFYFLEIKDYPTAIAALANIYEKTGAKDLLFRCFEELVYVDKIDIGIVNNFLECFKKYDKELYIKGVLLAKKMLAQAN